MKIEIAEPGRMTQSGSSLLRLIQNNNTPILDLLVRESVQNSLDAKKDTSKFVSVEFDIGSFKTTALNDEFEGITDALNKKYQNKTYKYIAIRDSETTGLTGALDYRDVKDNNYGNLLKLIYEICKPQEAAGAGGSWGLGKTVYFRIGIGLVIYYSRISDGKGGFSSRLAASYVEDERNKKSIIPAYKDMAKRGIAWWGSPAGENTTVPVTDESYINRFLSIFDIRPYVDDETGTTIIIPYINTNELLSNNKVEYTDAADNSFSPFWYSSIEKYLSVAVQRWYAPRLGNPNYPYGPFLKVLINGKGIAASKMEPVFQVIQSLYNHANNADTYEDILDKDGITVYTGATKINKYLVDTNAGNIAFAKVNKDILGMNVPSNKPEPAMYFNCEIPDKTSNRPFVCFSRKPGMIVSYENISAWTNGIASTSKDEFIIGFFSLNSLDRFKDGNEYAVDLEEYVRKSEMADHTSWADWSEGIFNPRIITKIQSNVTRIISKEYMSNEENHDTQENSELGKYFGDMLLPPDGFGKGASPGRKPPVNPPAPSSSKKTLSFTIDAHGVKFNNQDMIIPLLLKTSRNKKITYSGFDVLIDSERGKIPVSDWENKMKLETPFFITDIETNVIAFDGVRLDIPLSISENQSSTGYEDLTISKRYSAAGTCFGFDIRAKQEHSLQMEIKVSLRLNKRDVRPSFEFKKEEKTNG